MVIISTAAFWRVLQHKWAQAAIITGTLFVIYFVTCNVSSPFNQYARLADAFLHGRLYLSNAPSYLELARYLDNGAPCHGTEPGCKGFVIDPPAPAALLVPFVAVFGTGFNQVWASLAYGTLAMGLWWVATRQLGWNRRMAAAMTVLAAVGTNFWWAAGDGGLWEFAHVSAVLFMMAALVEATGRQRPWLVGLLLGLAGLSRLPTFLGFPFFLHLLLKDTTSGDGRASLVNHVAVRKALGFCAGLGAMAVMVLAYNYTRYHTILDRGYSHPQYAHEPWFAQGRFNIAYIPRHIQAMFTLGPQLNEGQFPFFKPSPLGMALIMVTPAFLYVYAALGKRTEVAAAVSVALVAIPHILHGTTGWAQFGYRFSLDYLPMLLVLTASGMGCRMGVRKWLIVSMSVFMSMWGPLYFFETRIEDILGVQWKL